MFKATPTAITLIWNVNIEIQSCFTVQKSPWMNYFAKKVFYQIQFTGWQLTLYCKDLPQFQKLRSGWVFLGNQKAEGVARWHY